MLQWDLKLAKVIEKEVWNKDIKETEKKSQLFREGLEPSTGQMPCHALANWATKSSEYQAAMFDGEGAMSTKCK